MEKVFKIENLFRFRVELCRLTESGSIAVSAKTGFGLQQLVACIESVVCANSDRLKKTFRVPQGGQHLRYELSNGEFISACFYSLR